MCPLAKGIFEIRSISVLGFWFSWRGACFYTQELIKGLPEDEKLE
jgi:hypothetical protein